MIGHAFLLQLLLGQAFAFETGNEEVLPSTMVRLLNTKQCYLAKIDELHMAAEQGNDTAIKGFISCGLDVDSRHNMSDVTPLYLAAAKGHNTIITLLLNHGANIEADVETEVGTLHLLSYAVLKNSTLAVTNLLDYGADVNRTSTSLNIAPIHWAVELDNKIVAKILIKKGADVNANTNSYWNFLQPLMEHNFEYLPQQPLGIAAVRCSDDMVELLVNHGSSIDGIEGEISPLGMAIVKRCEKVALQLLKFGASTKVIKESWSPLHWAVIRQMGEVIKYLGNNDLLNARDSDGRTLLHIAVQEEGKILKILLDCGADVNATDDEGYTPLHDVRSPEAAELLLKNGADVNAKGYEGKTPLHDARSSEIVELLLESGADIDAQDDTGKTPLHTHAVELNIEIVKVLLMYNASMDITCQEDDTYIKNDFKVYRNFLKIVRHKYNSNSSMPIRGLTPMALAAGDSNEEILSLLMEKNISKFNLQNAEWPPFHVAVCTTPYKWMFDVEFENHTVNLKFLVDKGADVNIRDSYNLTSLHKAIMAGRTKAITALLDLNAEVNAIDVNGWTPLHAAVYQQDIIIVEMLIKGGCDINIADRSGFTSLIWSVIGYRPYFFELMVDKNLELNSTNRYHYLSEMGFVRELIDLWMSKIHKNCESESILDLNYDLTDDIQFENMTKRHINLVTMIANNADDIDIQDQIMGWTALHWASASGNFDTVKLLVERGACMYLKSFLGHTPMFLARYWGHKGIYEYLKQFGAVW